MTTVAPGRTPPPESTTVPEIWPVSPCARPVPAAASSTANDSTHVDNSLTVCLLLARRRPHTRSAGSGRTPGSRRHRRIPSGGGDYARGRAASNQTGVPLTFCYAQREHLTFRAGSIGFSAVDGVAPSGEETP